jgi:hypothetical protein
MTGDSRNPDAPDQAKHAADGEANAESSCCSQCNCGGYEETTPLPTMKCKNCGHASSSHSC